MGDILSCDEKKWNRLIELQSWLLEYNTISLFGEAFNYCPYMLGDNYIQDGGDQEQASWWVWAQTILRKLLGDKE